MSTINQFRQQLLNGGHRQNRFKAIVNFPTRTLENAPKAQESFEYLCFSTQMPTQALGEVPVKFRGRTVYFAGDMAEPEAWTCTVYNTLSFDIRNACVAWKNNYIAPDSVTGENLIELATVTITMLDKQDKPLQECTLYNAWPLSVGQVQGDWSTENQISTFELQLRYDYIDEKPAAKSGEAKTIEGQ